ncbi:MAG: C1 family peptidase [Bacteroidales bacterium]|nr:C1 family peptidase [Bacteroidales bacterium]
MKTVLHFSVFPVIFFFAVVAFSQDEGGIINNEMLIQIKSHYSDDAATKAITNAITNNDINKLACDRTNAAKFDNLFTYKVETKGITDQKSSGRCWLFASLNVMRPKVIDKYNLKDFYFSHTYSFFWDQLEKSNLFLESIIQTRDKPMDDKTVEWLFKNSISDGGVWSGFVNVVQKYGVVPDEVMPESYSSKNTRMMWRLIRRKLKEDGLKLREMYNNGGSVGELRKEKTTMLGDIYHMLAINLGEPPDEFEWRYEDKDKKLSELKTYTPKSFYDEFVGVDLQDYVLFMDDPTNEYFKLYEIELDRNIYEGVNWQFINLPADEFKPFAVASIKDNEAMYFSCDVGKQLNKEKGVLDINNYDYNSLLGVDFGMNKKQRIETFESGSTHGMTLIAVDLDADEKINKWLLENSWGKKSGKEGYLVMSDEWFDEYMFRLVINKKYVSDKILEILKLEPILLPPWDPMFAEEE